MGEVTGSTSDGHHTFDELYEHRHWLFINLLGFYGGIAWWSRVNADGSTWDGWIVAGIDWEKPITYHLPIRCVEVLQRMSIPELDQGRWDGHTPDDVIERLKHNVGAATRS